MSTTQSQIIRQALINHTGLALRSENYARKVSFLDLSADQFGLSELDTPDWQVIYGRRGTGKTHLLRSFEEFIRYRSALPKSESVDIVFYFSAQDFRVSEEEIAEKHRARSYFQIFLDQLASRVLAYVDYLTANQGLLMRLIGNSAAKKERVEELALQIGFAAQYGDSVGSVGAGTGVVEKSQQRDRKRKAGSSANLSLGAQRGIAEVSGSIGGEASASSENQETNRTSSTFTERHFPRLDKVKDLLIELVDTLSVERIIVLIDEWPLLDPTGLTKVQPEFANLLKRIFSGSGRVSVKIATNRFQTRLSYRDDARGTVGLETDADIFEAVNLDHALLQERELQSFYETMIFKRLCFCSPDFSKIMLRPEFWGKTDYGLRSIAPEDVPAGFIEMIFKDRTTFVELTKGCEGIPRDFLELFNRLVKKTPYNNGHWTMSQVRDVIRESKISSYLNDLEYNSPSYRLLNLSIREVVLSTGRREVSVHIDDYNTFSVILEVLMEKRIIHDYPVAKIPDNLRDRYKIYLIDYGYCLDWLGSYEADIDAALRSDELNHRDIEAIRLKEEVIEADSIIVGRRKCPNCEQFFSPEAKSYVKKKLCPSCFELVD